MYHETYYAQFFYLDFLLENVENIIISYFQNEEKIIEKSGREVISEIDKKTKFTNLSLKIKEKELDLLNDGEVNVKIKMDYKNGRIAVGKYTTNKKDIMYYKNVFNTKSRLF